MTVIATKSDLGIVTDSHNLHCRIFNNQNGATSGIMMYVSPAAALRNERQLGGDLKQSTLPVFNKSAESDRCIRETVCCMDQLEDLLGVSSCNLALMIGMV